MPHRSHATAACPVSGIKAYALLQTLCLPLLASSAVAREPSVSKSQFPTAIADKRPTDRIFEAKKTAQTYFYEEITGVAGFWRPEAEGGVGEIFHKWSRRLSEWSDLELSADFPLRAPPGPLGSQAERDGLQTAARRNGASSYVTFTNLQQSLALGCWKVDMLIDSKESSPFQTTNCTKTLFVK